MVAYLSENMNSSLVLKERRNQSTEYGMPCVSKLYINSECNILIAGIYKCPGTFINHHQHLYITQ